MDSCLLLAYSGTQAGGKGGSWNGERTSLAGKSGMMGSLRGKGGRRRKEEGLAPSVQRVGSSQCRLHLRQEPDRLLVTPTLSRTRSKK